MAGEHFLEVEGLSMRFGGLLAVDGIEFGVKEREIFAIIGPNGAGKTTVFNCISGFYRPTTGRIRLQGREIAGLGSHTVARHGVVRTFQNVRLFKTMTALENLLVAQHRHLKTSLPAGLFKTRAYRESEKRALERALHWLDYMELREFANRPAGNLAYGHQRRLEIARCMVTEPRVLMLDEPAAGLNPQEKKELQGLIQQLRQQYDLSVLLIEHDMSLVMGVSERILVMEHGRPIALDVPEAIQSDQRVIKAYLGEE
ncbi:MAG TPA: high-affinity branched-chain amino acid ABC transporter ATP-binding protein LivG [Ottowia sp.]|uniref:high-affinity branched-chain amino acid ABC transporter ATP-binding protein LivG n=1 Tax=Ottowia sp. TaxID=1898956 RepID=UPI002BC1AEDD|nr:high-affinity branched-chain amino acid ABC transporter ATP-binding protein LivG [Ottowia sp.]HMN21889.1 high-affinity branched-chain amino acid ABC transporter ATP-binding protein LivG [Ottowia sp.]